VGKTYTRLREAEALAAIREEIRLEQRARPEKLESRLMKLGLGRDQIAKQSLKEIKQSLLLMTACISNPESYLRLDDIDNPVNGWQTKIINALAERKKNALERYSALITSEKVENIRRLTKKIGNQEIEKEIEKNLVHLLIKETMVSEEYHKLEEVSQKQNI